MIYPYTGYTFEWINQCECEEGEVLDGSRGKCVTPENCPGVYASQSELNGSIVEAHEKQENNVAALFGVGACDGSDHSF